MTGTFVCPYTGVYMLSLSYLGLNVGYSKISIMIDDISVASATATETHRSDENISSGIPHASALVVQECYAGQLVWLRSDSLDTHVQSGNDNQFTAYLLQRC